MSREQPLETEDGRPDEAPSRRGSDDSAPSAVLQEAMALRRAAQQSGTVRRRRRAEDDDDEPATDRTEAVVEVLPEVAEAAAPHRAVAVGWPAEPDQPPHPTTTPDGLGWPPAGPPDPPSALAVTVPPPAIDLSAPALPVAEPSPPRTASPGPERSDRPRPDSGWRRALYVLTGGLVNAGETSAQQRRRELVDRIAGSTAGCHRIAVISLKGGVGKTTMSVCLGAVLASIRSDRVIAVDANPDRGTLSGKVPLQTTATVRDLLARIEEITSYGDIRRYTSQSPDRLEILVSSADPTQSDAFGEQDYRRVVHALEDYYSVVVTDCGTGLLHSAMTGVLDLADQLVVVSTNSVDGANSASATLDWLQAHGHADLVRGAVAVVNAVVPGSGNVDQDRLAAHFAARCRAVVRIPHDRHLEAGAEVELAALGGPTRDALLAFATEVVTAIPAGRA